MIEELHAVTANLGCCGPGGSVHRSAADAWLVEAGSDVDLVFVQEVPAGDWLAQVDPALFTVHTAGEKASSYRCRSAVLVRPGFDSRALELPQATYHGSYLAGAEVDLPGVGTLAVVSVHASPTALDAASLDLWEGPLPIEREGGGRDAGKRFDSEFVLDTISGLAAHGPVLAAGDYNESRLWDEQHVGETWGTEFFDRVTSVGLVDCLDRLWGEERATRGLHQIDHVLASPSVAERVMHAEVLEHSLGAEHTPSDHRPVAFTLRLS